MFIFLFVVAVQASLFCPTQNDFNVFGDVKWNGNGWTLTGASGVHSTFTANVLGGFLQFDMDLSGVQDGINTNLYGVFPQPNYFPEYCDIQPEGGHPICMEIDFLENNGRCFTQTTWHVWEGITGGCDQAGCGAHIVPNSDVRKVRVDFPADPYSVAELRTFINGQEMRITDPREPSWNETYILERNTRFLGLQLHSTQWLGWVPGEWFKECPKGGTVDISRVSVKNVIFSGGIVQGENPTTCDELLDLNPKQYHSTMEALREMNSWTNTTVYSFNAATPLWETSCSNFIFGSICKYSFGLDLMIMLDGRMEHKEFKDFINVLIENLEGLSESLWNSFTLAIVIVDDVPQMIVDFDESMTKKSMLAMLRVLEPLDTPTGKMQTEFAFSTAFHTMWGPRLERKKRVRITTYVASHPPAEQSSPCDAIRDLYSKNGIAVKSYFRGKDVALNCSEVQEHAFVLYSTVANDSVSDALSKRHCEKTSVLTDYNGGYRKTNKKRNGFPIYQHSPDVIAYWDNSWKIEKDGKVVLAQVGEKIDASWPQPRTTWASPEKTDNFKLFPDLPIECTDCSLMQCTPCGPDSEEYYENLGDCCHSCRVVINEEEFVEHIKIIHWSKFTKGSIIFIFILLIILTLTPFPKTTQEERVFWQPEFEDLKTQVMEILDSIPKWSYKFSLSWYLFVQLSNIGYILICVVYLRMRFVTLADNWLSYLWVALEVVALPGMVVRITFKLLPPIDPASRTRKKNKRGGYDILELGNLPDMTLTRRRSTPRDLETLISDAFRCAEDKMLYQIKKAYEADCFSIKDTREPCEENQVLGDISGVAGGSPARETEEDMESYIVDSLIPCYTEGEDIILATALSLTLSDQPDCVELHRVWVLDDAPEAHPTLETRVNELREKHHVHAYYFSRKLCKNNPAVNKGGAKSLNVNTAISFIFDRKLGEQPTPRNILTVTDCDHITLPTYLSKVIRFYEDPDVCMVQTPQYFYNIDPDGDIFGSLDPFWYFSYQPVRERWDSVMCCGTNFSVRAVDLISVGLFPYYTATEDTATSLELHSIGKKIRYMSDYTAAGQSPSDLREVVRQRIRWMRGNLAIFFYRNPLTVPNLTLAQRIIMFMDGYAFISTMLVLVFTTVPMVAFALRIDLATGIDPSVVAVYLLFTHVSFVLHYGPSTRYFIDCAIVVVQPYIWSPFMIGSMFEFGNSCGQDGFGGTEKNEGIKRKANTESHLWDASYHIVYVTLNLTITGISIYRQKWAAVLYFLCSSWVYSIPIQVCLFPASRVVAYNSIFVGAVAMACCAVPIYFWEDIGIIDL